MNWSNEKYPALKDALNLVLEKLPKRSITLAESAPLYLLDFSDYFTPSQYNIYNLEEISGVNATLFVFTDNSSALYIDDVLSSRENHFNELQERLSRNMSV